MFKETILHYPDDDQALAYARKELTAFWCAEIVKYMESLNLSDSQIEAIYAGFAEEAKMQAP